VPAGVLRARKGLTARYSDALTRMTPIQLPNSPDSGDSRAQRAGHHAGGRANANGALEIAADLRAYVATRVPAQDVDDVVQDVLLRWVERAGWLEGDTLEPWLITTARNRATDVLRARGTAPVAGTDALGEDLDQPVVTGALAGLVCCLGSMLDALAPAERELLRRVDAEGGSQAELAAELGLSASGLRARVQRARARLRAAFVSCCDLERDAHGAVIDWNVRRTGTTPPSTCGGC
jgi:RNA polymerase sigma-70 factor (ECF subfamily)